MVIERAFGDDDAGSKKDLETTGTCPECGELDGLISELVEEDGKLIFQKSECQWCGYNV